MQNGVTPVEPDAVAFPTRIKGERKRFLVSAYKTNRAKRIRGSTDLDHFFLEG